MLFNSLPYILAFLPLTLAGWFWLARSSRRGGRLWLAGASLLFYGWWDWRYLALLLGSVAFNYMAGRLIAAAELKRRRLLLGGAIAVDLALLGWFKYADFFRESLAALAGTHWAPLGVALPLGISFFTFTQIAFLVDVAAGKVREADPLDYLLFVSFFPHLLAGPVLHHAEMMPQFADPRTARPSAQMISTGLTLFLIGLVKKTVLADGIAPVATLVFDATAHGGQPGMAEAWAATLAYSFELYFDFSGYSDMALGAARLFGIVLPLNFASPYQAASPIEFWRRWHMTLSRFLRDYLYISLGGNRQGRARRYLNLFLTMLLGGLWHGAAWTFVAWGAFHGLLLMLNHAWRAIATRMGLETVAASAPARLVGWALTFLAVMLGWVLFRADGFDTAGRIFAALAGHGGAFAALVPGREVWVELAALGAVAFLLPNSQSLVLGGPEAWRHLTWRPTPAWALLLALGFVVALGQMSDVSPFLYYRF
ncbi:alginate O-acetyltransferase [Aliidongia dinghuensis]|uniref:Probable alginate O-acetylase AlgI n=1 Tax=Aliidongia dinghuensis TaxID=1867774 RepID=A0A8J3E5H3_9PROT|nr:MBOAT family protein [Aliidongia dinghuensis]GGF35785.1 alginate O-acetyltransferase [Aliidongia dinghuensis]